MNSRRAEVRFGAPEGWNFQNSICAASSGLKIYGECGQTVKENRTEWIKCLCVLASLR
jgi:hypothetical protein